MSDDFEKTLRKATTHLKKDAVMARVIKAVGKCELKPARNRFELLVGIVVSQMISTKAADTIRGRIKDRAGSFSVKAIGALSVQDLRECGLSNTKANCLLDLAEAVKSRDLVPSKLAGLSDDEVRKELCRFKGLGNWSAEMFLMFGLVRPDILPVGDLGLRSAVQKLYSLEEMPDAATLEEVCAPWRPYATFATWYGWQSLRLIESGDL